MKKSLKDTSLASLGLVFLCGNLRGQSVHETFHIVYLVATSKAFEKRASFAIVLTILRVKAALSDFSFGLASRSLGSFYPLSARRLH